MTLTWTSRNGTKREIKSPLAKFLILTFLWLPIMAICGLIHAPIWLVNGRGFLERQGRAVEFNPPGWASLIALVIYATVLVWAVTAIA